MGCEESRHKISQQCNRLRTDSQHTSADSNCQYSTSHVVRAVLLGDASVGKSSLSVRYFHDQFPQFYDVTFGGVFFKKNIELGRDSNVSLHVWDTGGEEKYRSMAPLYYRNASIAFLVCSLTDRNPTNSLQYWLEELSEKVKKQNLTIVVLANKNDLATTEGSQTVREWCSLNRIECFECSAKTGSGVSEAFGRALALYMSKVKAK